MNENKRIVLFLDIDDTLSNQKTISEELEIMDEIGIDVKQYRAGEKNIQNMLSISRYGLDMLDKVVNQFNINEIVISSTWRLGHSLNYIKLIFYYRGYAHLAKLVKDITPVVPTYTSEVSRKLEIEEYVKDNLLDNYYILDDMFIDIPGHYLVNRRGWGNHTDLTSLPDFEILPFKSEKRTTSFEISPSKPAKPTTSFDGKPNKVHCIDIESSNGTLFLNIFYVIFVLVVLIILFI